MLLEVNARFPGTMPLTVHSGVNMPLLSLRDVLGEPLPSGPLPFRDIAVVRYWTEEFIDPAELAALNADLPVPDVPSGDRPDAGRVTAPMPTHGAYRLEGSRRRRKPPADAAA